MPKIVIFSDLHAHQFKSYATILPNGMNSRLADAISIIKQVQQVAIDVNADAVLFGGDMFHIRRQVATKVFNAVFEAVADFAITKIPLLFIHGNHDQADKQGNDHSVYAFRLFCTVVDEPGWVSLTGKSGERYAIMAVPYTENIEHLRDVVSQPYSLPDVHKIFLGHLGIQGARIGADFVYENPHDPQANDLSIDNFDVGFLGHYHEYQNIAGNFWYVGAPMQHTWGDAQDKGRGCIVYDTDSGEHERIELQSPKFVVMDKGRWDYGWTSKTIGQSTSGNYVRLVDKSPWTEDAREEARKQCGARTLEIVPPKADSSSSHAARLDVSPSMSYQDMVDAFVKSGLAPSDDLDPHYLIQIGREILESLEEE